MRYLILKQILVHTKVFFLPVGLNAARDVSSDVLIYLYDNADVYTAVFVDS